MLHGGMTAATRLTDSLQETSKRRERGLLLGAHVWWRPRAALGPCQGKMLGPANCLQRGHDESGDIGSYVVQSGMVLIEIALFNEGLPLFGLFVSRGRTRELAQAACLTVFLYASV
jgi:hypothetical protein